MAADLGISVVGIGGGLRVSIRDLIHPSLNESLKGQQQVTFKLVKTGKSGIKPVSPENPDEKHQLSATDRAMFIKHIASIDHRCTVIFKFF